MVLACDGIWNFMSSQDVCDFILPRLVEGRERLSQICEEVCVIILKKNTKNNIFVNVFRRVSFRVRQIIFIKQTMLLYFLVSLYSTERDRLIELGNLVLRLFPNSWDWVAELNATPYLATSEEMKIVNIPREKIELTTITFFLSATEYYTKFIYIFFYNFYKFSVIS